MKNDCDAACEGDHRNFASTPLCELGSPCSEPCRLAKRFGPQESRFSFPMAGYTLALDFPANARTLALLDRLDAIAVDHGGRFYLAKDARMSAATLHRADPRAADFRAMRQETGCDRTFASAQSERLLL